MAYEHHISKYKGGAAKSDARESGSLYNASDMTVLKDNWAAIMEKVQIQKYASLEPTYEEILAVHKTALSFVKHKKRKIYGGYALNLLVKQKDPQDAIYKSNKIADIDFYSPDPIQDLIELCNILHEKGFKYVVGKEAQHKETYSITVNQLLYCDISYVPRNIYNTMPFMEIDGYAVIHPHFMWIDYLRMMTDPLLSYWRFETDCSGNLKSFKRFHLLQKHFPLPQSTNPIDISGSTPGLDTSLGKIEEFIRGKKTLLSVGFLAYNLYVGESKISDKKIKKIEIPYYEMISTNYRDDCLKLLEFLKSDVIIKDHINHKEFFPYFQLVGHSVEIYYDADLIARIYTNNMMCIPYIDVKLPDKSSVRVGTFHVVLLYSLASIMRARSIKNLEDKNLYYTICSHIIEMRNHYLETTGKTFIDAGLFAEFTANCAGETIQPDRQRQLLIEMRKKQNKRYVFRYEPADGVRDPGSIPYQFANSSGNEIKNIKHLKLADTPPSDDMEGDFDDTPSDDK